ncbi:DUF2339 domain-containing protein [Glaesserella sp.]|uniref:DUF2339 domain-containing protein n=1 Tax=Glaesserella sp. TaxID=2094731 RepID=UPI0035A072BE
MWVFYLIIWLLLTYSFTIMFVGEIIEATIIATLITIAIYYVVSEWQKSSSKVLERIESLEQELHSLKQEIKQLRHSEQAEQAVGFEQNFAKNEPDAIQEEMPTAEIISPVVEAVDVELPASASQPESQIEAQLNRSVWQNPKTRKAPKVSGEAALEKPNILWNWLMQGNPILKIGGIILFLGLAFLLRFASEHFTFPIEARYISVALVGVACGTVGWLLRHRRREYGLTLQGLGIAILYLTSLASFRLHDLLPVGIIFAVQIGLVALMIALAVIQNSPVLAQIALLGGLASPVLLSDGSGNYIVLFSYLALLNTGVAVVAWFKSWRLLNVIGAMGTIVLASGWGITHYQPELYLICQGFLAYFLLLYSFVVWRFADKRAKAQLLSYVNIDNNASFNEMWRQWLKNMNQTNMLDSGLLFGSALGTFGLQFAITNHWQFGGMLSAVALSLFYLLFGYVIYKQQRLKIVAEALFALSLVFMTLAIGSFFTDNLWNALLWSLQAALIYGFGIRQKQPLVRLFALGLWLLAWGSVFSLVANFEHLFIILSGIIICLLWQYFRCVESAVWEKNGTALVLGLTIFSTVFELVKAYFNGLISLNNTIYAMISVAIVCGFAQWYFRNLLLVVASGLILLYLFMLNVSLFLWNSELLTPFTYTVLAAGNLMVAWLLSKNKMGDIAKQLSIYTERGVLFFGFIFLVFALNQANFFNLNYPLNLLPHLLLAFIIIALLAMLIKWQQASLFTLGFLPIWGSYALWLVLLHLQEPMTVGYWVLFAIAFHIFILIWQHRHLNQTLIWLWHGMGFNLFLLLLSWILIDWAFLNAEWLNYGWMLCLFAILPLVALASVIALHKPVAQWQLVPAYLGVGLLPTMIALMLWTLIALISDADNSPLPYIPLVNPLELMTIIYGYLMIRWSSLGPWSHHRSKVIVVMGLGCFALISVIAMRMWHYYDGIEWQITTLLKSLGLQATLSVIWTICAISLMLFGNKRRWRNLWFAGATLIGLVVLKLFFVELSNSGGVERIVSFISVGVLLLLVGYFAPIPPIEEEPKENEQSSVT